MELVSFACDRIEEFTGGISAKQRQCLSDDRRDPYLDHAGTGRTSVRTLITSMSQLKLFVFCACWYLFQLWLYTLMANYLIYVTFHDVPPDSPSYPGQLSTNGTNPFQHKQLYDLGQTVAAKWDKIPYFFRFISLELPLISAQAIAPMLIILFGRTKEGVNYAITLGLLNLLKGVVQLVTIQPPARDGELCWKVNFPANELVAFKELAFGDWFFRSWGTLHGCNDMLYSGHAGQCCLGFLLFQKALRSIGVALVWRSMFVILFFCYLYVILACRLHYTVDLLLAIFIATLMFTHAEVRSCIWLTVNFIVRNPINENSSAASNFIARDTANENGSAGLDMEMRDSNVGERQIS